MVVLKILLALTILSIPTGEILRINVSRDLGINLISLLLSLTAFYGTFYLLIKDKIILRHEKFLILFVLIGVFSLLLNSNNISLDQFLISILYPIRFLFIILFIPIFRATDSNFKKFCKKLLIIDGVLIISAGFIQFFLYPSLRNLYYLGWDEHLYRLFSTFLDPNFTAVFIALFIIFIFPKTISILKIRTKTAFFFILTTILSIIALILTYSRAVLLSFSIVTFLFLFLNKKKYIPVLILILGAIIFLQLNTVRSEGTNLFRITSTVARIGSSSLAISVIRDHPILGVGLNSYRFAVWERSPSNEKVANIFPSHTSAPENSFLFVLATTGIIGFVVYIMFWRSITMTYLKNIRLLDNQVIILSIITLFISSFFINALFYTPILLWFFSVLGIKENN